MSNVYAEVNIRNRDNETFTLGKTDIGQLFVEGRGGYDGYYRKDFDHMANAIDYWNSCVSGSMEKLYSQDELWV